MVGWFQFVGFCDLYWLNGLIGLWIVRVLWNLHENGKFSDSPNLFSNLYFLLTGFHDLVLCVLMKCGLRVKMGFLRSIISMFITLIPDKLNVRFCFLNSGVVWSSADVIYLKMVQLTWFLCNLYVLVIGFCFLSWNVGFMGIWIWSKYDCYDIECYELCKFVLMCLKIWNFKLDQITKHFLTFDDLFFCILMKYERWDFLENINAVFITWEVGG